MKLPTSVRYAVRILMNLCEAGTPVSIASIAEKTNITPRAVENLHAALRKRGITAGTVGARGGISLRKPLSEISLNTLVEALDEGVNFAVCCGERTNDCPNQETCPRAAAWRDISAEFSKTLSSVSLRDIMLKYRAV